MLSRCIPMILAVLLAFPVAGFAQEIDGGRGPIPLTVPSGYEAGQPAPLVVLLHGYTSSGKQQDSYMKFSSLADEYGYFFLAPDGTKEKENRKSRFWNATEACCNFQESTVDDSAYVRALIDGVKEEYSIDPKRVYLIGHSNGGFMSYRAAYDHSDVIAAIASLAGASISDLESPAPPNQVHVLQIHGTEDTTILYEGGEIQGASYPSADAGLNCWAAFNGCGTVEKTEGDPIDLDKRLEGNETTVTRYTKSCESSSSVELWSIQGGTHVPILSDQFGTHVIEWLMAHPKSGD